MDVETAVRSRRTHKAYRPEPVDRPTLDELLELARWAPNHHLTNPWRFRVLGPGALERLKAAAGPEAAAKLDRAPTLVVCSCVLTGDEVQDEEDLHATAVAAYSPRALPQASVSTPLAWDELSENVRADHFKIGNLRQRLAVLKDDPWPQFFKLRQRIPAQAKP